MNHSDHGHHNHGHHEHGHDHGGMEDVASTTTKKLMKTALELVTSTMSPPAMDHGAHGGHHDHHHAAVGPTDATLLSPAPDGQSLLPLLFIHLLRLSHIAF